MGMGRGAVTVALLGALAGCPHPHPVADGITNPPVRKGHGWRTTYEPLQGALFAPDGPSPYDVEQGEVGTCWLLAAMAATAHQQPEKIRDLFRTAGPGTFSVRFREWRRVTTEHGADAGTSSSPADLSPVTITSEVPHRLFDGPIYARSRRGTWVGLLEKAYAQEFAPEQGYEGIGGDHPRTGLGCLTGWSVEDYDVDGDLAPPPEDEEWRYVLRAYRGGAPIVAGSRIVQLLPDIVPMHAYTVTGMWEDERGERFVKLFDPESLGSSPNRELTLTLDQFNDYFFYVSIAHPPERASSPAPAQ